MVSNQSNNNAYWQENLKVLSYCLAIWFVVSFGFGILLRESLDTIRIGGYGLGFWFAQQGSILVFLGLVFFYSWKMNKLDETYGVEEKVSDNEGDKQSIDALIDTKTGQLSSASSQKPRSKLEKDDEWEQL